MKFQDWGRDIVGWGSGTDDALARIATLDAEQLAKAGITRQQAIKARDFYRQVYRRNTGNTTAAARVQLMEHILDLL